jgi:hypothetical protein
MPRFVQDGQQRLEHAYAEQFEAELQAELDALHNAYVARAGSVPIPSRARLWLTTALARRKLRRDLREKYFGHGRLFSATGPEMPDAQQRDTNR